MSAGAERRREDLRRLDAICASSGGKLSVLSRKGEPPSELTIRLACRTAPSADYPATTTQQTRVRIQFPARYPFQEPLVEIESPIFHPNVYSSGRICFGTKWLPTEGLDLLVKRIAQIVIFDPALVNVSSPANPVAAAWYRSAIEKSPSAFPSDSLAFLSPTATKVKAQWRDLGGDSGSPGQRNVKCGACEQQLRIPDRPGVSVRCPKCGNVFKV